MRSKRQRLGFAFWWLYWIWNSSYCSSNEVVWVVMFAGKRFEDLTVAVLSRSGLPCSLCSSSACLNTYQAGMIWVLVKFSLYSSWDPGKSPQYLKGTLLSDTGFESTWTAKSSPAKRHGNLICRSGLKIQPKEHSKAGDSPSALSLLKV